MGFYKDQYIKAFEEELDLLEGEGVPSEHAYRLAGDRAYGKLQDKLADRIDELRQRMKEGGW